MNVEKIMHDLEAKHPGEAEYLQAVREVLISIEDVYNQHPEFEKAKLIERLVEPKAPTNTLYNTIPICVHFAHLSTNRLTSCRYFACHFVKKAAKPFIPKS